MLGLPPSDGSTFLVTELPTPLLVMVSIVLCVVLPCGSMVQVSLMGFPTPLLVGIILPCTGMVWLFSPWGFQPLHWPLVLSCGGAVLLPLAGLGWGLVRSWCGSMVWVWMGLPASYYCADIIGVAMVGVSWSFYYLLHRLVLGIVEIKEKNNKNKLQPKSLFIFMHFHDIPPGPPTSWVPPHVLPQLLYQVIKTHHKVSWLI